MCCRLQLDLRELLKRGGGLFGSAEMTGSIGVVTINAARLGYLYKGDKKALYDEVVRLMDLAKSTLEKKRVFIQGVNEMIRNFTDDKNNITDEIGTDFALELLDFMREKLKAYQEETGNLYNLDTLHHRYSSI